MTAVTGTNAAAGAVPASPAVDPEVLIASLEQQIGDMQLNSARSTAARLSTGRDAALAKARKSLREAREKEEEGGFWSKLASKAKTVATVATVVAAAAAIGTGAGAPAGLALAAAACSMGSLAMKETGADAKLTTLTIGDTKLDLNLSDCVALAGVACGAAGSATAASNVGASTVAEAASGMKTACAITQVAAQGTAVAATGTQAVFVLKAGDAQASAVESHADSREQTNRAEQAKSKLEDQVDVMRSAMETRRKVHEAVSKMMEQRHETIIRLMEVRG